MGLTESSLRAFQDHLIHSGVGSAGHRPWVITLHDILHALAVHDDVVDEADALAQRDDVEIVGEEVQVDVGLLERVGRVQLHGAVAGERAQEVDDYGEAVARGWRGDVPLEGVGEHGLGKEGFSLIVGEEEGGREGGGTYDEIDLEVRLAARSEGVDVAVLLLVLDVFLAAVQVFVNTWETDEFEETAAQGPGLVFLVGLDGGRLHGTRAQDVVVETVAVLEMEDVGQDGVVEEVLPDVGGFNDWIDTVPCELFRWANTREQQQLGRLEDTGRDDDFPLGVEGQVFAVRSVNIDTPRDAVLDDQPL